MKSLVKKIAIYSMIGIMQAVFCVSVIEASPRDKDFLPMHQRYERDQDQYEHDRMERERHEQERMEKERHERERIERERHERAMRRRHDEDERAWHERQRLENERHEENMRRIAHDILDLILDN
jgi:membrane protein involved in colicin uptake